MLLPKLLFLMLTESMHVVAVIGGLNLDGLAIFQQLRAFPVLLANK